jgi:2-methylcitrate dehydratase PrpD
MVKESIGWGAATAVASAFLADGGFDGTGDAVRAAPALNIPPTPFDDERRNGVPFITSLGVLWHSPKAYVKPYACCRAIHAGLDGLIDILANEHWRYDDIRQINVSTLSAATCLDYLPPLTPEHAQYSFPYALGCVAVYGQMGAAHLTTQALADPRVLSVAGRVRLSGDSALDEAAVSDGYPVTLSIAGPDRCTTLRVTHARGGPKHPLSLSEVVSKFTTNSESVLSRKKARFLLSRFLEPEDKTLPSELLLTGNVNRLKN